MSVENILFPSDLFQFSFLTHGISSTRYFDHEPFMKAQWVATFCMLLLWLLPLMISYVVEAIETGQLGTFGERIREKVGEERSTPESPVTPITAASSSKQEHERKDDGTEMPKSAEDSGYRRREIHRLRHGEPSKLRPWIFRLNRASRAARTAFLMLFISSTLLSLPVEIPCHIKTRTPSIPTPPPSPQETGLPYPLFPPGKARNFTDCVSCMSNASSPSSSVLSWVFFALTVSWILIELLSQSAPHLEMTRSLVTITSAVLIVVLFTMALRQGHLVYLYGSDCLDRI